jgi:hypothetical protein
LATVTHAESGTLARPPKVGRHRPDLVGKTSTGAISLGDAKLGPELTEEHTQEQLEDFLTFAPDASP